MKVLILICSLGLARAGVISTNHDPSAVSTVYSSFNAPEQTLTPIPYKTLSAPAPVYESVLSTHESRTQSLDGTQHDTFAKTLNTPFSSVNKYDSRITNDGLVHSVPVYSNAQTLAHPVATYNVAAPVVHSVSSPITYTAHPTGPVVTKTITPGVTTYSSHSPVVAQPAVKITYSEAPLVSHMTFTGLGTSYSW